VIDHFALWSEQPIVAVDCETTGWEPGRRDRIIELAAVRIENRKIVGSWRSFMNPECPIPWQASRVHGLYDEDVAMAPKFRDVAADFVRFTSGAIPAAYKAGFDYSFVMAELWMADLSSAEILSAWPRWFDPLTWIRSVDRFVPGDIDNKLGSACARRGITLDGAHGALADATALAHLIISLIGDLPRCTASELIRRQSVFAAASGRRIKDARGAGRLT
jgi:DNA polymerase-3 subunit epsilon